MTFYDLDTPPPEERQKVCLRVENGWLTFDSEDEMHDYLYEQEAIKRLSQRFYEH